MDATKKRADAARAKTIQSASLAKIPNITPGKKQPMQHLVPNLAYSIGCRVHTLQERRAEEYG
jgi:hypothetical protein